MRVDRLVLQDFRGIEKLEVLFPGQVTLFAGVNGSGKSSILEALAALLWRVGGLLAPGTKERDDLQASDIHNGCTTALLLVNTDWASEGLGKVDWGLRVTRVLSRATKQLESVAIRPQANRLEVTATGLRKTLQEDPRTAVPLAVLYRTNRAVLDIPLRIRKRHVFDQFSAYEEALDDGWSSFRLFFEWFREREDLENELRLRNQDFTDPVLDAVRRAVAALMPGFRELRVQRQPLGMRVTKDGVDLDVGQLSDGEKCLLAMVADIARRLALANPKATDPCQETAVVMIDEIELHLHPGWQRKVVPGLVAAFPKCQFVLTTHSPQVLGSVRPEDVWLLDKVEGRSVLRRPHATFGRESNEILLEVMGTPARPEEIRQRLDAMFRCIDAGELAEARRLRTELERDIGVDEPEFVRADMLLRLRNGTR
jgi:predicted ATP-binding protein involved in virulence